MFSFNRFSLKQKITAVILAASCIVLVLSSSIFVGSQVITYKRQTVGELNSVADIIASNVTAAVVFDDPASAQETLTALRAKPGIEIARIYTNDGALFTEYMAENNGAENNGKDTASPDLAPLPDLTSPVSAASVSGKSPETTRGYELSFLDGYVDLYAPIHLDGEVIGTIYIRSNLQQMHDIIDAYLLLAGFVILSLIIITILIAGRLQKVVSEPVLSLLGTMQTVSTGQDYSVRATKFGNDELGELTEGFNQMLAKIQANDDEMRQAWREAEAASRAKTEFLANMSHELRTPLNAIIGFSEIIKGELLGPLGTERYRFYSEDIFDSGHHLLEVINDILDISKVEAGEFELSEEVTNMGDLIKQSLRLVQERAQNAQLALIVEVDQDLPHLFIDQRLIKQSLINLLSNAVKFSPNSGSITIRAAVQNTDGSVHLSVTDTGIGIPEDQIGHVLQPFSQVESAFSRSHEGTGLGLPLTKSFVEAHGGKLEVRSKLGEGTSVIMQFPKERIIHAKRRLSSAPAAG